MKIDSILTPKLNCRRNAFTRLLNRILNLFGYHLTKMPRPYTEQKRKMAIPQPAPIEKDNQD